MNDPNGYQPAPPIALGINIVPLDTRRDAALSVPLPPLQAGEHTSVSTTRTRYRLRWTHLHKWEDFDQRVLAYWNDQVMVDDKQAIVANRASIQTKYSEVASGIYLTEPNISDAVRDFPANLHGYAANGAGGSPLPSDMHSQFFRCAPGAGSFQLIGHPDLVLHSRDLRVTCLVEVKNPWLVTPQKINDVLDGTAPRAGLHQGRHAVEQLYGYMVRSGVALGILTTMKGWCFLQRQDGGQLFMTRMYGYSPESTEEGFYYPANGFTIMLALYYFSQLSEVTPAQAESTQGQPGTIHLPWAERGTDSPAPFIQLIPPPRQQVIRPAPYPNYYGGGPQHYGILAQHSQPIELLFEPWKKNNQLGNKSWIARILPEKTEIVLKLWDGWKVDTTDRDNEITTYLHLQSLWGKYIPRLLAVTHIDFCHALIIEYLDASPVSSSNLTPKREKTILKAFDAVHALGILHGDARLENILISNKGDLEDVWLIDFEFSLNVKKDARREDMCAAERRHVVQLLADARMNKP